MSHTFRAGPPLSFGAPLGPKMNLFWSQAHPGERQLRRVGRSRLWTKNVESELCLRFLCFSIYLLVGRGHLTIRV
jgi:hypothetical protein